MKHYILASHGGLAQGMKTAVEMICGKNDNLSSYDLEHFKSPDEIRMIIEDSIKNNPGDSFIIFTDLFGGSIQTALLNLTRYQNTVVISDMHLGLILMMLSDSGLESEETLQDKADSAIQATMPMIAAFTNKKIKKEIENIKNSGEDEI